MNIKKHVSLGVVLATIAMFGAGVPLLALADTVNPSTSQTRPMMRGLGLENRENKGMMTKPVIVGTVVSVNGNTLTVTSRQGVGEKNTATTFTVDATNAKIMKNSATSTVANISVNDTVIITGTLSGTTITATVIRDVVTMKPGENKGDDKNKMGNGRFGTSTPPIQGNGQPIVAGKVSAISGSTITLTNNSNVTYTVDASGAKVLEGNVAVTLSNVKVGDTVLVQGAVSGTSVTASTIFDQTKPKGANESEQPHMGFFGGIGQFFSHMFGF